MRKVCTILTGIVFTLLLATCKQFTADIDDYLGYWSSEAYITDSVIKAVLQNDLNSIPSVPSTEDVSVTFKLQNPKSFPLDLPPEVDAAKKVIAFEHLTQTPAAGTDYTLTQSEDRQSLTLTYKASFLQAHEWGEQDLSATLTLYAKDGRKFKQTHTLKIKANTPPPTPIFTVAKTKDSPSYYVLCITAPEMNKSVLGGLLHKDLAHVEVNGTAYAFSVDEGQHTFVKPEADVFITQSDVEKLNEPKADEVPAGGWVLYYKTDVEVKDGAAKKDYTVRLADAQGLVSGIVNANIKPNKAEAETIRITKGTKISGSGSESDPGIIGSDSAGAELSVSSATPNTTVHCTLTETGSAAATPYNGNPVTVPLPLNGTGEKRYKLEYYTDGEGFTATPVKTVYYKVVQGHTVTFDANGGTYPDSTTTVSKTVLHGNTVSAPDPLPTKSGFGVTGWYKDAVCSAGQAWNFATDTVTGAMTLYAQWTAGAGTPYKVEHYQETVDGAYPSSATATEDKTGVTEAILSVASGTITPKTDTGFTYMPNLTEINGTVQESGHIKADGSTVVKLYYQRNKMTVIFDAQGGTPSPQPQKVRYEEKATAPSETMSKTGYTFDNGWYKDSDCTAGQKWDFATDTVTNDITLYAKWTVNTYDVTFSVVGEHGTLKANPEDGTEKTTNATDTISVEHGKKVTFTAVPSPGWEVEKWILNDTEVAGNTSTSYELSNVTDNGITVTVKFKKTTYKVTFSVNGANGTLKATVDGIEIHSGDDVEKDKTVTFTASPNTDWKVKEWTVSPGTFASGGGTNTSATLTVNGDKTVTVKFYRSSIPASSTWKDLLLAVKNAPQNGTITIEGTIKATNALDDHGEIVIDKDLTVKGETGASANILDANSNNPDGNAPATPHRIFKVESGVTLTLEKLTLQNGKVAENPDEEDNCGGGLFVKGSVKINNCIIQESSAPKGAAIYMDGTTLALDSTIIKNNTVALNGTGVVYIKSGTGTMTNGEISGSVLEQAHACGVYLTGNASFTMQGSNAEISGNTGGVALDGSAEFIMQEGRIRNNKAFNGGGVYMTGNSRFTMKGGYITKNTAEDLGHQVGNDTVANGGGVYAVGNSTCTMSGGTIEENTAERGGGVYVAGVGAVPMTSSTFSISGSARIVPSAGDEVHDAGKNDVYLAAGAVITVTDTLTADSPIARISPAEYPSGSPGNSITVLNGDKAGQEHGKFTVTRQPHTPTPPDYIYWIVDADGVLKELNTISYDNVTKELLESVVPFMSKKLIEGNKIQHNKNIFYITNCGFYGVMQITGSHTHKPSDGNVRLVMHFKYKTFNHNGSVKIQSDSQQLDHAYAFKLCSGEVVYEFTPDNDTDLYFTTLTELGNNGKVKKRWLDKLKPCNNARFFYPEF